MRYNLFGEAQPGNYNELLEVIDGRCIDPINATVFIADGTYTENEPFNGWCAEISFEDITVNTVVWSSKEDLVIDLKAAGFVNISEI